MKSFVAKQQPELSSHFPLLGATAFNLL